MFGPRPEESTPSPPSMSLGLRWVGVLAVKRWGFRLEISSYSLLLSLLVQIHYISNTLKYLNQLPSSLLLSQPPHPPTRPVSKNVKMKLSAVALIALAPVILAAPVPVAEPDAPANYGDYDGAGSNLNEYSNYGSYQGGGEYSSYGSYQGGEYSSYGAYRRASEWVKSWF
ncbi:hypothetical protein FOXYSP1_17087 [Fusarium oxysporum f. sp. phaseoli]